MDDHQREMYFSAQAMNDMINECIDPVALEGIARFGPPRIRSERFVSHCLLACL